MTENKRTVERYIEGFNRLDHAMILSCLTEDVVWHIPGMFHTVGKEAFDREIENDAFVDAPTVKLSRLIEEDDVVAAEGTVRVLRKQGSFLHLEFCDLFDMRGGLIRRLTSYMHEVSPP